MHLTYQTVGEVEVIQLHDGITAEDAHELLSDLLQRLRAGRKQLILNLHDTRTDDNSLIGFLGSSFSMVKRHGGRMVLVALEPRHGESYEIAKVSTRFDVYDSEAEAIASFA